MPLILTLLALLLPSKGLADIGSLAKGRALATLVKAGMARDQAEGVLGSPDLVLMDDGHAAGSYFRYGVYVIYSAEAVRGKQRTRRVEAVVWAWPQDRPTPQWVGRLLRRLALPAGYEEQMERFLNETKDLRPIAYEWEPIWFTESRAPGRLDAPAVLVQAGRMVLARLLGPLLRGLGPGHVHILFGLARETFADRHGPVGGGSGTVEWLYPDLGLCFSFRAEDVERWERERSPAVPERVHGGIQ